jgi:serine phosphatase RsbU (regulator of sigma subunit)
LSRRRPVPDWLLAEVNRRLLAGPEPGRFVTAFMACLAPDGRLEWCSAGQGPVYVSRRAREDYDVLPAPLPPLGVEPDLHPRAESVPLGPGGRVMVLSDGIVDADNGAGQILGPRRLKTVLDNTAGLPLDKVVSLVRDILFTWQGASAAADDQSLLVAGVAE